MEWYKSSTESVLKELSVSESGLSAEQAENRLKEHGENKLPEPKRITALGLFLRQFESPLIYILLISAVVVFLLGHIVDSSVIAAVLIINALFGALQEGKAQNSLKALQSFVKTDAIVIRGGVERIISDIQIVPGDIILLKEGDKIPADSRIISADSLVIDESALTGESESIRKSSDVIDKKDLPPADQKNMVFKGTYVISGMAKAVVVGTGLNTFIGSISSKLISIDSDMPLKKYINSLSRLIIFVVSFATLAIFLIGLYQGVEIREMFVIAVAIAVSAIPEGLPVVVTLILATGVYRMGKRNALVKKLQAVEALGQANVVAVDKTGTLTLNQMTVNEIYTGGKLYNVSGAGYEPKGGIMLGDDDIEPLDHPEILMAGRVASLTSSANFAYLEDKKEWQRISGDPTEVAMLVFSEKIGFVKDNLLKEYPKLLELPFNSSTKHHSTINEVDGVQNLFTAGAPEILLTKSDHVFDHKGKRPMTEDDHKRLSLAIKEMSSRGLRVIALAIKENPSKNIDPLNLPAMTFVALLGIADVLREEAFASIRTAQDAGIRVVMITGDHIETAKAIANKAGIYKKGDDILTGKDLESLDEEELKRRIGNTSIFARVTPEHKMKIIEAYKKAGIIIAMTGDGVNDALSLSAADLGVSMGKNGTDVAKEASDIVLLDDNFASIIAAIEEGRNIYRTIKKVVLYLFSTGLGEMLTIGGAMLLGFEVPMSASQIIWLNFVTDGFLVVALAMEPKEGNLLVKNNIRHGHRILDGEMYVRIVFMGAVMMLGTIMVYGAYLSVYGYVYASTMALTILSFYQWFNAMNVKSDRLSMFNMNHWANKYLVTSLLVVILLQLAAVYLYPFQFFLGTTYIKPIDWLLMIVMSLLIILADEVYKALMRFFDKKGIAGPQFSN